MGARGNLIDVDSYMAAHPPPTLSFRLGGEEFTVSTAMPLSNLVELIAAPELTENEEIAHGALFRSLAALLCSDDDVARLREACYAKGSTVTAWHLQTALEMLVVGAVGEDPTGPPLSDD